jgi:uncharacterized protein
VSELSAFPKLLKSALATDQLELIIMPTEQCNFRCVYCYEDFKLGRMSAETILSIKQLIEQRSKDIKILRLDWFGGEPLLAKDVVIEISRFAQAISAKHGIAYSALATTNAFLLTPSLMNELCSVGVATFQVSLDGDELDHDSTRVSRNGHGTFKVIWKNLIDLKSSDIAFNILIRLHVSTQNDNRIFEFAEKLIVHFGGDDRFKFIAKGIENLGAPGSAKLVPSDDVVEKTNRLLRGKAAAPVGQVVDSICYAAKPSSFVVRSDGSVSKCTVWLKSEKNKVGHLRPEGQLSLDINKLNEWFKGFESFDRDILSCPAKYL